jgi:allantoicase
LKAPQPASFTGLVDLASSDLGARAVGVSDDFFAEVDNMLQPEPAVFIPDKYTERGKWMDGWESRRKRGPGHDWAVIALGAGGQVIGFDVDTSHFNGNQPQFVSVEGVLAPRGTSLAALQQMQWSELLEQSPVRPAAQNLFGAIPRSAVNFVRLHVYPDGGVARFRVFGKVSGDWHVDPPDAEAAAHVASELVDLAAVKNGGRALACSDAHFGPMNNLLLPGRARNMGGGWETRRSRRPNQDWILIELAARGTPRVVEIDTKFFCGNYPDRAQLEIIDAPGARITDLIASDRWRVLLPETKLAADSRRFFEAELLAATPATHVRMTIFPDGGVSRLRVWGTRDG